MDQLSKIAKKYTRIVDVTEKSVVLRPERTPRIPVVRRVG
jgi:hypothetical protein